jgi:hypothetical protein
MNRLQDCANLGEGIDVKRTVSGNPRTVKVLR